MSGRAHRKAAASIAAIAAIATITGVKIASAQYCPCFTASSSSNTKNCGIEAAEGDNPSHDEWNAIFDLVSQGPAVWGDKGPSVSDINQGCGKPEVSHKVSPRFPCELLKGIAMQESGWRQFCVPTTPADQKGKSSRTIISGDCGYGIGQVTSGMHTGESPDFDRDLVASDPTYNLATGTRILAGKWKATKCVGDNQPSVIEHWYSATWAYNGLSWVNNPNNPTYGANRGVWNPSTNSKAPYQERVFGWIEDTPYDEWIPTQLAYPNPGDIGDDPKAFPNAPPELPEPSCASPTDCVNTRATHKTICDGGSGSGGAGGGGGQGGSEGPAGVGGGGIGGSDIGSGGNGGGQGGDKAQGGEDTGGSETGGCSCRTAAGSPTAPLPLLIAFMGVMARSLRRRARHL